MPDAPEVDPASLESYGVRSAEASFNLSSGRIDEIRLEIHDHGTNDLIDSVGSRSEGWWTVVYNITLGSAQVKLFPEVRNPTRLASILRRGDEAIVNIEYVDEVVPWHTIYADNYDGADLSEVLEELPHQNSDISDPENSDN